MTLDDYILTHITPEDAYLHRLYRATQTQLLRPRMASGHLQGQLLRMLAQLIRPESVLEIGTYSGYSALCMAAGMQKSGHLLTFEINDEQEDFTRPWLEQSPYLPAIEMVIGNVLDILPTRPDTFDMAFIDGDKRQYPAYYELVKSRMRPGGYIIADNTLWDGHVVEEDYQDAQTIGIRKFNDLVAEDADVEQIILPMRDGLSIIHLVAD